MTITSRQGCSNCIFPGLSLAIIRDGRVSKAQGYGFANLELRAHATKETVYEIGSNTKQFTAAAIMKLVEAGKIHLEDSIVKYFPEAPEAWRDITIRYLLTHTSGIQNHVVVPHWLDVFKTNLAFDTSPARDELLKMFFKLPLEFQPGEIWAYDNTGYYLLGIIIEKAIAGKLQGRRLNCVTCAKSRRLWTPRPQYGRNNQEIPRPRSE